MASSVDNRPGPPEWINASFLEKTLQQSLKNLSLQVLNFEARIANAVGDHYGSEMYRITVKYSTEDSHSEDIKMIIKCLPGSKELVEVIDVLHSFEKESHMLETVLPRMFEVLSSKSKSLFETFGPKCLHVGTKPVRFILMEDLASSDFRLANRMIGLDLDHCILAIKMIAQFHASSAVLLKTERESLSSYEETLFSDKVKETFGSFIKLNLRFLAQEVSSWGVQYSSYIPKLESLVEEMFNLLQDLTCADRALWLVLCHGDLWINNMLFKYEGDEVVATKFLDYQLPFLNSPVVDLQYFFHSSTSQEVRAQHLDYLLNVYNVEYNYVLNQLGYFDMKITYEDLHSEYNRYHLYGLYALTCVYPVVMRDSQKELTIDDFFAENRNEDNVKALFSNKTLIGMLKRWLPFFDNQGVL